ncbi:MAG: glycoside hydrolase family 3 C-terminal domain-containing protein [Lachnospiraceae bacterium]|nr:glycoside hydrolase family 3 C-terminal domain-containing protein [Lachnospiraceae bacterium]
MFSGKIGVPMEGLAELGRLVASQGAVLLKNEKETLPIQKGEKVAIFGRCQIEYYRSGTGSGGAVNVPYTTNLLDGMRQIEGVQVDEALASIYADFIRENPFDNGGGGWAAEPWFQKEMPLDDALAKEVAERNDKAVVVIGRTAGEDKDNVDAPGSYQLTEVELQMLKTVCAHFDKVIVALNVSNIIDMSFMCDKDCKDSIQSVIYLWHGGIEGGNAAADVLTGRVTPSGKLSDTIVYNLQDYPSTEGYGDPYISYYKEDIYVGYRYFETFAPDKVMFPFGYGLSYTKFEMQGSMGYDGQKLTVSAKVKNIGDRYAGKEVVQVYVEAPQGKLGKASRSLVGFAKTSLLIPGQEETVTIEIPKYYLASYDDSGATGHKSCYVLEAGEYHVYIGDSIRCLQRLSMQQTKGNEIGSLQIEDLEVIEQLSEAAAPVKAFDRLVAGQMKADGTYQETYAQVPLKTIDIAGRIQANMPSFLTITGDQGIRFKDVQAGKATLDDFVAQLNEAQLATLVRGEGMCSEKVTPGTAAAFGGVSDDLASYGIPVGCCADGPSGIRMDNGAKATQLPIGTLLACTWDAPLVEKMSQLLGKELVRNEIDSLLGPGLNIHRNPLNGRNFEYFSEDPLLTGKMAAAVVRGIASVGTTGTMKHFACNNQETGRQNVDAIVSERALREIYLRGFEIGVKEGHATSIMTTYNPLNGYWNASNYDLNTTILRKEWGFEGIVMTDWWARMNDVEEGGAPNIKDTRSMIRSQNDLFMVVSNNGAEVNTHGDNTLEALKEGKLTLGEMQRCAKNILTFLLKSHAANRPVKTPVVQKIAAWNETNEAEAQRTAILSATAMTAIDGTVTVPVSKVCGTELSGVKHFAIEINEAGQYDVKANICSTESDRAQQVCQVSLNGVTFVTFQINGNGGRWVLQKLARVELESGRYDLELKFITPGMQIEYMELTKWDK